MEQIRHDVWRAALASRGIDLLTERTIGTADLARYRDRITMLEGASRCDSVNLGDWPGSVK